MVRPGTGWTERSGEQRAVSGRVPAVAPVPQSGRAKQSGTRSAGTRLSERPC